MYGVTFGNKHSYDDFNLVLTSRNIPLPEPKTYAIEVPGADGVLDLSTALTDGDVKYQNRIITMTFAMMTPVSNIETLKSTISNYLHGKVMDVIFDADDSYIYKGRLKITEVNTEEYPATMTIEMDADPYKYNLQDTVINGSVTDTYLVTVPDQKMKVVPVIYVSADMSVTNNGTRYYLYTGDNIVPAIRFSTGANNKVKFYGTGTFRITFRGGEL